MFQLLGSRVAAMKSDIGNQIQHRDQANDIFLTPANLAKSLIENVPIAQGDVLCDAFAGLKENQPFYENYPETGIKPDWMEIREGLNAFSCTGKWDWIITNPPFSLLNMVLQFSTWSCRKGFAFILPNHGLSYRRIKFCETRGFRIIKLVSFPNPKDWNIGFSHLFVVWMKTGQVALETVDSNNQLQLLLEDF
jgi:hypothetical protein